MVSADTPRKGLGSTTIEIKMRTCSSEDSVYENEQQTRERGVNICNMYLENAHYY